MNLDKEPLITVGAVTAIVSAVLVFLKSLGVDISNETQEAIRRLVAVLAPIVLALIARQYVYAPDTVREVQSDAYKQGLTDAGGPVTPV